MIGEYLANGRQLPVEAKEITVVELLARFWQHAEKYYVMQDGTPTSEITSLKQALRPINALYGDMCAKDFTPCALKAVRQAFIDRGMCRKTVNQHVNRVRRVFKWGVAEDLVPPSIHEGLRAVEGLRMGRSEAKDHDPVTPVPEARINAVAAFVSPQVWAIIQLQLATAARPGELLSMRPIDLDTSGEVWLYKPVQHKGSHRGRNRIIYVGPRAQKILAPFLSCRAIDKPLFSPAEAENERHSAMRASRTSHPSVNRSRDEHRRDDPKSRVGDAYDTASYRRAIRRGCEQAEVEPWHPHRLRHNAATNLRREFGLEAAQLLLGHAQADVTQIYAEKVHGLAVRVALKIG